MKKYLIALAVALMVCMLGVTASAAERSTDSEDYKAAEKEQEAITEEYWAVMDEMDSEELDLKTRMEIMTEAYENAGWTVIHETPAVTRSVDIDPKIWELAYSDIDKASLEQREKIIDAREVVINQYSWQNDIEASGMVGYVINPFDREIIFPPLYSELFPGWDPPRPAPVDEAVAEPVEESPAGSTDIVETEENKVERASDSQLYYYGDYNVPKASGSVVAPDLCSVPINQSRYNEIRTGANSTSTAGLTSINIGYNNGATGKRLYTYTRLQIGYYYAITSNMSLMAGVTRVNPCISTYGTPGYAFLEVKRLLI